MLFDLEMPHQVQLTVGVGMQERVHVATVHIASPSGQAYWSGGSTFGPYIAFAYAAARSIVAEPARELRASAATPA